MNVLTKLDCQKRDAAIINMQVQESIRTGESISDILRYMASEKIDGNQETKSYEVDAPLVLMEGERIDHSISEYFFDPSLNSKLIPSEVYFHKWMVFISMLSSRKSQAGQTSQGYAFSLLQRAVHQCERKYGTSEAKAFAQRLHDNRWSTGSEMTASLFITALTGNQESEFKQLANDRAFVNEYVLQVRRDLKRIKEDSKDLTEWNEAIYSINPDVSALMKFLRVSDLDEAEKWYRFFAEVDADITPSVMRSTFTVIEEMKDEKLAGWRTMFHSEKEASDSLTEFKKRLQYLFNGRTTIPKFWMELALIHYETSDEALPPALYQVDPWNAVSIDVLSAWGMKWQS
ncbi:hypothetical protein DMA11_05935 [Marinilabiliaceae bacterium JC017]|nr:hypothetical protein DMA11_05935 [Marinilabiliaceae bacterium JC017]